MKKIYIAGPMRGIPYYNFDAFFREEKRLSKDGWIVVNPARLDVEHGFDPCRYTADFDWNTIPEDFDIKKAMARDLEAVAYCDAIYMLDGWKNSRGATAEYHVAKWWEKEILFETPDTSNASEGVLEEALRITSGQRQRDYDHPKKNHDRIARLWNAYLFCRKDQKASLEAEDVAQMMILLKIARQCHMPKRDNLVDIAGYARCLARITGEEP